MHRVHTSMLIGLHAQVTYLHVKVGDAGVGPADGKDVGGVVLLQGKQVHAAAKEGLATSAEAAAVPRHALSCQLCLGQLKG